MGKKRKQPHKNESLASWVSSLAKETVTSDTITDTLKATTKEDRIAKRAAKKQRREERLQARRRIQQRPSDNERSKPDPSLKSKKQHVQRERNDTLLFHLSGAVKTCVVESRERHKKCRPLETNSKSSANKARVRGKNWEDDSIQPRKNDYGGIGLARASLFLPFNDPSLLPKLRVEFEEHIPGFYGKQRTRANKKQTEAGMLWRQVSSKGGAKMQKKINGKRLADMSPDERVEAMISAGLV